MSDLKNDIEWVKLFGKYKIIQTVLEQGQIVISANQINEFREARLMTKFDHKSQLPKLFSENNLSILPISRGNYIIANIETFHSFNSESDVTLTKINFPGYLESIDYRNITSEATAINCAYVAGVFDDFIQEEKLCPTVSGRMSSSSFEFNINTNKGLLDIKVENSQLEIDGGYEGVLSLNLIEAKNYISDDFLVRQLYYPYKLWSNKIRKTVRPIFLTYTNGIFHLREYAFEDPNHYNSIQLIRQKKYAIRESPINIEVIQKIQFNTKIIPEPDIPFPQADSFERIINLCEILKEKESLTRDEVTLNYDFDVRQTNYYTAAGKYLGLISQKTENHTIVYFLTREGNELFGLNIFDRQLEFVKLILSHGVFKRILQVYFEKGELPSRDEIVTIMKESNLYNVHEESTFRRRASTIICWINWIVGLVEEA